MIKCSSVNKALERENKEVYTLPVSQLFADMMSLLIATWFVCDIYGERRNN